MKSSSSYTAAGTYPPPLTASSPPSLQSSDYGTIPTHPSPPPASDTLPQSSPSPSLTAAAAAPRTMIAATLSSWTAKIKENGKSLITSKRPWIQVLDASAFGLPASFADAYSRVSRNLSYFRSNYYLLLFYVYCISLIRNPGSFFVFISLVSAWFFLFYCRDQPLVLFNHPVYDVTVLVALTLATAFAFFILDILLIISGANYVSFLLVLLHAAFRKTDDLYLGESEAANGGLVAGAVPGVPANGVPNQIDVRVI